ncbi:MAG: TIGR03619 family F420-dependent LLM class oxidoreductase [Sandaracinaceae bacterium]|jgi:probable F420-dependent oxidoreductase|nr:TIGR03619 family F420-dependent LLM class oxidoreductase [Sandaracinaceae bacterium]MBK7155857.1 TIGR03619 family F420-dependent LLM class oxidoreductase [Sandaracinaceae bacterium]MBK7778368.1 TIGR03619 family F420-dependent LLM class oxidoreductase [Sandaracinaceae bacterium]MBK8410551.1 TIGR03619 family F420-dependent LLM class oxidoreductase [Sandaracinaceae bacterium]
MRFSYAESMCDPSFYMPLAKAAEEAGYTSVTIPDSICYPEDSESKYPYNGTGDRAFLSDKPFIEPFSLIPALGAVTSTIRFTTFVVKLPIRSPVLVAKSVSSVAVLTNDRFGFGVGLSPWPEDFEVTFTEWKTRGKRMDEMIAIIRGLLRGEFFAYEGQHYTLPSIKICPAPKKPVPILIGGHAEAALKRAAYLGDGWMFAGGAPEELSRCLDRLAVLRREAGRENEPFEIHAGSMDAFKLDGVKRLEDQGITDVIVGFRNAYDNAPDIQPLDVKIGALRKYADKIISKL